LFYTIQAQSFEAERSGSAVHRKLGGDDDMAKKFSDLVRDFPPERRARIDSKKDALRREIELAELREALAPTQSVSTETPDGR
jgi:hypothetical protein